MFLNTISQGGELCFPHLSAGPVCIAPKAGQAVVFHHRGKTQACDPHSAHRTQPTNTARFVLQRFYFSKPFDTTWADVSDDGVSPGDFGISNHETERSLPVPLSTVRCDGSGSCREYVVPRQRRESNAMASTAIQLLHQSSRLAKQLVKKKHTLMIDALRLMSRAIVHDPYNVAVRKLLVNAQVPLLGNKNAVRHIAHLQQQCVHSTRQALHLASHDVQLIRTLHRLESGSDMSWVVGGVTKEGFDEDDDDDEEDEICVGALGETTKRKFGVCNVQNRLPKLFVLGFQKCGTSSLHEWLIQSSLDIVPANAAVHDPTQNSKELHFFNTPHHVEKGLAYYASHFQSSLRSTQLFVDATNDYIWSHSEDLVQAYGGASHTLFSSLKFLFILQKPEDRLVSWWNHFAQHGWIEDLVQDFGTLESFTKQWLLQAKNNVCRPMKCEFAHQRLNWGRLSGIEGGRYGYWMQRWLAASKNPNQTHVMFLSNVQDNKDGAAAAAAAAVFNFLGVHKKSKTIPFPNINRYSHVEKLSAHTLIALKRHYEPWNCYLLKILTESGISHGTVPLWLRDSKCD